jgi:hypothetical protein
VIVLNDVRRDISIFRGNNLKLQLERELEPGDQAEFTVRKQFGEEITVVKVFDGDNIVELLPADTSELPAGRYLYDVAVRKAGGEFETVIAPGNFRIQDVVSQYDEPPTP